MKRMLTLPTWQVFLLLIVSAFLSSDSMVGYVLAIIWGGFIAYCMYFLGISLYYKLPDGHDLKIETFRFNLIFSVVYILVVLLLFDNGYEINQDNYKDYGWIAAIILPLHLFTMYCIFYSFRFIAKCISTIENNRVVGFGDYAGDFFLICFFPFGIWFVHPKVRHIFQRT